MVDIKDVIDPKNTLEAYAAQYKEEARLAKGSFGTVYRVSSESGTKYVAKKISLSMLNGKEKQQVYQEARVAQMLRDRNVVGHRDTFIGNDKVVIVMEYCEGKSTIEIDTLQRATLPLKLSWRPTWTSTFKRT